MPDGQCSIADLRPKGPWLQPSHLRVSEPHHWHLFTPCIAPDLLSSLSNNQAYLPGPRFGSMASQTHQAHITLSGSMTSKVQQGSSLECTLLKVKKAFLTSSFQYLPFKPFFHLGNWTYDVLSCSVLQRYLRVSKANRSSDATKEPVCPKRTGTGLFLDWLKPYTGKEVLKDGNEQGGRCASHTPFKGSLFYDQTPEATTNFSSNSD